MLSNYGAGEDSSESLGIQPVNPKGNWPWILSWRWSSNTLAWCKEPMHWKRPWCCERLRAGGEGDDRGWDGWLASLTQWTWVWVNSRSWWWTGRPGVLRFMGSQGVGHDWATELNWTDSPFIRKDTILPFAMLYVVLWSLSSVIRINYLTYEVVCERTPLLCIFPGLPLISSPLVLLKPQGLRL